MDNTSGDTGMSKGLDSISTEIREANGPLLRQRQVGAVFAGEDGRDSRSRSLQQQLWERSIEGTTSTFTSTLTKSEIRYLRKMMMKDQEGSEQTWTIWNLMLVMLAITLVLTTSLTWKRLDEMESDILTKTLEVGYDVALTILQNNPELLGKDKVATILQLAERELQLRHGQRKALFGKLGDLISTAATSEDLLSMADINRRNGHHLRALLLFKISLNLYRSDDNTPEDVAKRIGLTVAQVGSAIQPLIQAGGTSREIALTSGVKYMEDLLDELGQMEDISQDISALNEGRCSVDIAVAHNLAGDHLRAILATVNGIKRMESAFRDEVSKYQFYGYLLNNQGNAYESLKDFPMAEQSYAKAVEAKKQAIDYQSEDVKQADILMTKTSLARVQSFIQ